MQPLMRPKMREGEAAVTLTPKDVGSAPRRTWEPMKIAYVGHLATVMQAKPGTRGDGGNAIRRAATG